jgi:hypothetical protein
VASSRDRRVGVVIGLVLSVGTGFVILLATAGAGGPGPVVAEGLPQFSPLPPPTTGTTVPPFAGVPGRDPFHSPGAPSASPPPVSPSFPTPTSPGTVSPPSTPPSAPPGASTTVGGHVVVLDNISTVNGQKRAQVEVDGTVYTVAPGHDFDGNFRLVSISGSCGHFLFGDQTFTLCTTPQK